MLLLFRVVLLTWCDVMRRPADEVDCGAMLCRRARSHVRGLCPREGGRVVKIPPWIFTKRIAMGLMDILRSIIYKSIIATGHQQYRTVH